MQTSFANDRFVVRSKSSNKEHEHKPTIRLLWSSTIIYMKLKSYSVILVDDNPAWWVQTVKHGKNHAFVREHLLGKWPSHFSHEGNSLRLFLARVWQLTISRYSQRIFRSDFLFTCNQRCPLGNFDWRVSLLIQLQWPVRQRTGLTKNADAGHPYRWFLSCLSPRLLAALEFVISASPLFSSRLTCLKSAKLRRLMYTVRFLSNCSKDCSNVIVLIVVNVLTYT